MADIPAAIASELADRRKRVVGGVLTEPDIQAAAKHLAHRLNLTPEAVRREIDALRLPLI